MLNQPNHHISFLKSALAVTHTYQATEQIVQWLAEQNARVSVNIEKIRFDQLKHWSFDKDLSVIRHDSGKFFSIEGIRVKTNWGEVPEWDQPIINQPEIGYLGFIVKEINGVWHFLLQGKIEPGNINAIQLSPTLQATKSNYTRVHQGKTPPYLDYFLEVSPDNILLDQLQSEQGARFLRKRNRNMIIRVEEDIELLPNYTWATLGQIKQLMQKDNLVNMDTRTVISGISYGNDAEPCSEAALEELAGCNLEPLAVDFYRSMTTTSGSLHDFDQLIRFVTRSKCFFELEVTRVPLKELRNWVIDTSSIHHREHKYFQVIGVDVSISSREVVNWSQPMIEPAQQGLCAFVCRYINGLLHLAVQAKLECGNFDIIELAPTVQCLTGNYLNSRSVSSVPFLQYVLESPSSRLILDTHQSEEGGRFYKEQNRNVIVMAGDELPLDLPEHFIWMSLQQAQTFIQFNNYFNIQARSLISAISFHRFHG